MVQTFEKLQRRESPLLTEVTNTPLPTEDTGVNTNPEKYRQDNGVDFDQVEVSVAGAAGEQNLLVVASGKSCRVTELTIRHVGTNDTVITLLDGTGNIKLTIDVPAQTTREWESIIGRIFTTGQTIVVRSSDITGGSTFVSGSGIEA